MVPRLLGLAVILVAASAQAQQQPKPAPQEAPKSSGDESQPKPDAAEPNASPELPPPPGFTPEPVPGKSEGEISLEEWDKPDWQLVEPKTALLELDGYFRFRGDLFRRLDLGNGTVTERRGDTDLPRYYANDGGSANFTSGNMRLRVEPQINVTEDIQIVSTFDILDNVILGSTPIGYSTVDGVPVNVLDQGQTSPDQLGLGDDIVVRRVYARVTALNEQLELRFGRMPSEWGLGILSNAGDCLDCDFGDTVDRISLTFKAADLIFSPMYDFPSSGPVLNPYGRSGGQPLDAVPWDDVEQYSLRVMKADGAQAIRQRVLAGQTVVNYGLWGIWRRQFREIDEDFFAGEEPPVVDPTDPLTLPRQERRDSDIYTTDGYLKLYSGNFELGLEGAIIFGDMNLYLGGATPEEDTRHSVDVFQWGGALEATWRFGGDSEGTALSLKAGGASGDSAPGFGALDRSNTQFGDLVATEGFDSDIENFNFSPDYHIDLLLFRRIIGTVTDAWYVRPEISYAFGNNIGGRFAAIYSQSLTHRSTPSGSGRLRDATGEYVGPEGSLPLGLELNGELAYGLIANPEGGSFKASFAGGVLFPLAGLDNLDLDGDEQGGDFAWTLQTRLYVTF